MTENNKRFLNFNGTNINILAKDGQYWVAVKPICEALGVDYIRQFKNLKEDEILAGVLSIQTMHDSTNRLQEMTCLPERYIYGWLFSINSQSGQLKEYKKECYDVLYNHFHGVTIERLEILKMKSREELELEEAKMKLHESTLYKEYKEKQAKVNELSKRLPVNDQRFLQGSLFSDL
jgi:hypothetical protein